MADAAQYPNRVGELRPNQFMFNYGVGALVDLPKFAVLVQGLDSWRVQPHTTSRVIVEPRLLTAVQRIPQHRAVEALLVPPIPEKLSFNNPLDPLLKIGVPVTTFPRWFVCPNCQVLAPYQPGSIGNLYTLKHNPARPADTRLVHEGCRGPKGEWKASKPQVVPARFLMACGNGHLDEFPWVDYVHKGHPCARPRLRLYELGESGQATQLFVRCDNPVCKAIRPMSDAFDRERRGDIIACSGRHPHLGVVEECTAEARPISLSASNLWFPRLVSVLSLPVGNASDLPQIIEENRPDFEMISAEAMVAMARQFNPKVKALTEGYSDAEVWAALQQVRGGQSADDDPLDVKKPEWRILSSADESVNSAEFRIEKETLPALFADYFDKVVLVHRLREVRSLVGFTRITTADDDDFTEEMEVAPLSNQVTTWLPAHEVRGEGVFIQFREAAIQAWLNRPAVWQQNVRFEEAHRRWRKARGIEDEDGNYPTMRFVLLHSFAHALMRALSLESGYSLASIRERIYSREATETEGAMAGVLIYTAAPDSEGTLGGLVNLGRVEALAVFMEKALESAEFCASDPLCAEHPPSRDGRTLHAAACHACSFLPETSCEAGNRYLDRAVLVQTVESDEALAFFDVLR